MNCSEYATPAIKETRRLEPHHLADLKRSAIDTVAAGLAGVSSIDHGTAYDFGIRGNGSLGGMCFRYWEPWESRFSTRFIRLKPDVQVAGRKYLQPVGEKPRLYFVAAATPADLANPQLPIFATEGEKKTLALNRALRELSISALVIGIGGVWGWRCSPKELQPDGGLGKGKSQPIKDLDQIVWTGRLVYLVFDSDVSTNWRVAAAETALARELARRGANVHTMRLQ